jgi:hypothetical protein
MVAENNALRRISEPIRHNLKGDQRKFHNKELHDFYFSPNIFRMIKSKRWHRRVK